MNSLLRFLHALRTNVYADSIEASSRQQMDVVALNGQLSVPCTALHSGESSGPPDTKGTRLGRYETHPSTAGHHGLTCLDDAELVRLWPEKQLDEGRVSGVLIETYPPVLPCHQRSLNRGNGSRAPSPLPNLIRDRPSSHLVWMLHCVRTEDCSRDGQTRSRTRLRLRLDVYTRCMMQ